ncbi:MAG: hypothetical protein BGP23_16005 [Lysobacterales bacterium 66-474]|nr:MAG: hypothetical protein BGP23_16005 [Xanthomonadales bacterium 66-474]
MWIARFQTRRYVHALLFASTHRQEIYFTGAIAVTMPYIQTGRREEFTFTPIHADFDRLQQARWIGPECLPRSLVAR